MTAENRLAHIPPIFVAVQYEDGNDGNNLGDGFVFAVTFSSEHDASKSSSVSVGNPMIKSPLIISGRPISGLCRCARARSRNSRYSPTVYPRFISFKVAWVRPASAACSATCPSGG